MFPDLLSALNPSSAPKASARMGITIDKWGPGAWNTLHCFAHSAPRSLSDEEQKRACDMLYLFGAHLPCPKCRRHFKQYLDEHVKDKCFATRAAFVRFVHDAHNDVSARLGKRKWTLRDHYRVYARPAELEAERRLGLRSYSSSAAERRERFLAVALCVLSACIALVAARRVVVRV